MKYLAVEVSKTVYSTIFVEVEDKKYDPNNPTVALDKIDLGRACKHLRDDDWSDLEYDYLTAAEVTFSNIAQYQRYKI